MKFLVYVLSGMCIAVGVLVFASIGTGGNPDPTKLIAFSTTGLAFGMAAIALAVATKN